MTLSYIKKKKNPKVYTHTTRVNEFSKFAGQINIQKPIIFLYTSNEKSKLEINKAFPFMYMKRIK